LLVGGNNTSNSSLSGNGSLTLTGGLITTLGLTGNQSAADLFGDSGRTGTLTLSGGNYTATHTMVGGASSVGALVINSGSTATISRWTTVGTGSVTLNAGGTFRSSESLFGGNGASMTINFNGGVFVATANHTLISNAGNFASISRNYNVQSGGAVINTNGFNVTAPGGFLGATGGGLTKQGSGNLTLSGNQASTYNGATIVSAGTLILTGNASISSTSGINVASGATFNNSSNFTVSEAFTLTEGAALAGNQSITMLGATIAADLANGFTSISAGANVGRGGALTFQLTNLTDGSYTIFSGSMTGNFTSVLIGVTALTDLGNGTFSGSVGGYDYLYASSSNSLSISAIPEPAAVAMVLFGAIGLMLRRRRLPAD
jgi:autotransporter-associated beta strand protein